MAPSVRWAREVRTAWVPYGRPAAQAVRAAIAAAKNDDPLAPVTVVVPSNHVGVSTRRQLASGTLGPICSRGVGLASVTFLTPYRLAELIAAPELAASGRRPVSTPVIAAALRSALADNPGVFRPVASHPATETALVATYRELRDLSPPALRQLATTSARAADVVRLHTATRSRLEHDWYDEEDLMVTATARFGRGLGGDLGTMLAYLPQRISRHAAALLGAANVEVLAGYTGDAKADADVAASIARLGASTIPPELDPMAVVGPNTRIVTLSDGDEEVRAAVRAVVDAARQGVPLDRIAILHASPEPYARLAHEHLSAAGIGVNGAAIMPLTARVAGRTLLQLLSLPAGGFRREDVFAWLAGARLHHRGHSTPVTAWERISREAGVVAGRDQWDRLLATYSTDLEAEAHRPDAPVWRAERLEAEAAKTRQLRDFVLGVVDDLDREAGNPRPWSARARWANAKLIELLGLPQRAWPAPEHKAAERVERALDRLACLDSLEADVDLDVFTRTLELELEADLGRVGRMGDGVLIGPIGMGLGLDLDLVVVLGLAEGSFPAPTRDDSLLPDEEREAAAPELPLRSHRIEREHRELLAALAGARRHLLCVPRGDLRKSSERVPSRWVLQIAEALGGDRRSETILSGNAAWLAHVASFDAGLRNLEFPASEQEHRLCSLLANGQTDDARLEAGVEVIRQRRSDRLTRFDGYLGGLCIPSPVDQITSATRLERWAACPFAYLLSELLGIQETENPEEFLQISPRDRGSLIHTALERFINEVLARPPDEQPTPDEPWSDCDRARLVQIGDEVCRDYAAHGLTGRDLFWRRDRRRIIADLERFLEVDSQHRLEHRTRPLAAELAFGLPDAGVDSARLSLPDGRVVKFRGKADRVDIAEDGALHILDYKTGATKEYKGLSDANPDMQGRRLQLAVYGQAARSLAGDTDTPVTAEYWFVTSAKGKFERIGYPVTKAVLERVGQTLGVIVEGVESGIFPGRPTASSTTPFVECAYCDPDGLGVAEVRSSWSRKQHDPNLAAFARLSGLLDDREGEVDGGADA